MDLVIGIILLVSGGGVALIGVSIILFGLSLVTK